MENRTQNNPATKVDHIMGQIRQIRPELLIVAVFSRHATAIEWARARLVAEHGTIGLTSEPYDFTQTEYYSQEMGADLRKQFFAFERLIPPERLPAIKLQTNDWEDELARSGEYAEQRPLNLDPGLLNLGKFMLATTKDQAHRIHLRDGVFAEVTLRFKDKHFEPWPWTYADYRLPEVREFLRQAREYYKERLREA